MRSSSLTPWIVGALVAGASLTFGSVARADEEATADQAAGSDAAATGDAGASSGGDLANWGVGGTEADGQFKPRGKTGKLKELEDDEAKDTAVAAKPVALGGQGDVWVDTVLAPAGSMIVPVKDGKTEIAPGVSYVVGASYRIKDKWEVGGRFATSNAHINGPADPLIGSYDPDSFRRIATGNLELSFRPFFSIKPNLVLPVGFALVLPTAMGDMFAPRRDVVELANWTVNQAAATARGWEDRALFEPNRFSIVPSVAAIHQRPIGPGILTLEGRTKIEVMVLTGGRDPLEVELDKPEEQRGGGLNDVAVNWLLGANAAYSMYGGLLEPSLRTWFAYATPTAFYKSSDNAGGQLVFEPSVATTLLLSSAKSLRLKARLSAILPAGGPLGSGDDTSNPVGVASLRGTVGLNF